MFIILNFDKLLIEMSLILVLLINFLLAVKAKLKK